MSAEDFRPSNLPINIVKLEGDYPSLFKTALRSHVSTTWTTTRKRALSLLKWAGEPMAISTLNRRLTGKLGKEFIQPVLEELIQEGLIERVDSPEEPDKELYRYVG